VVATLHRQPPLVLAEKPKNGVTTVSVLQNLLSQNNHQAEHNRSHFDAHKVLVINLMSSPVPERPHYSKQR